MLRNPHVRQQKVVISVAKDGTLKQTLVVETNLDSSSPQISELAQDIVAYMKEHDSIDSAEIGCTVAMS